MLYFSVLHGYPKDGKGWVGLSVGCGGNPAKIIRAKWRYLIIGLVFFLPDVMSFALGGFS